MILDKYSLRTGRTISLHRNIHPIESFINEIEFPTPTFHCRRQTVISNCQANSLHARDGSCYCGKWSNVTNVSAGPRKLLNLQFFRVKGFFEIGNTAVKAGSFPGTTERPINERCRLYPSMPLPSNAWVRHIRPPSSALSSQGVTDKNVRVVLKGRFKDHAPWNAIHRERK